MQTLKQLVDSGLTEDILYKWRSPLPGRYSFGKDFNGFGGDHRDALIYLIRYMRLTPRKAVKEISELGYRELHILFHFYSQGLRGDDIRQYPLPAWYIQNALYNLETFTTLMETQNLTCHQALKAIAEMEYDTSTCVLRGFID